MSALSQLLQEAHDRLNDRAGRKLSYRDLQEVAHKAGHTLSHSTISKYVNGKHGVPDEPTLAALSDVFEVPIDHLRRAAGVPIGELGPYEPPAEANRMDRPQRRAVDQIIRLMVRGSDGDGNAAPIATSTQQDGEPSIDDGAERGRPGAGAPEPPPHGGTGARSDGQGIQYGPPRARRRKRRTGRHDQ